MHEKKIYILGCEEPHLNAEGLSERVEIALWPHLTLPDGISEKKTRSDVIDILGATESENLIGDISVIQHESGWTRFISQQLPSGTEIAERIQSDIVSDPDVGLSVDELTYHHSRIRKKVLEEYAPLLIAHTAGIIGRPLGRGVEGFDAVVQEEDKEINVSIKTIHKNSSLLKRPDTTKALRSFFKLITPLKADPESIALLIPFMHLESPEIRELINRVKKEGIAPDRIRLLDTKLLKAAGAGFVKKDGLYRPAEVEPAKIGVFRTAAALERSELFEALRQDSFSEFSNENGEYVLNLAQCIRDCKENALKVLYDPRGS